jgi:hypothetical protein
MRNRVKVGQVPTEKEVQVLIEQVAAIQQQIESFTTTLTRADRLATTKMRVGGEKIVATLAQLAEEQAVALPSASGEEMTASLTLAQRLEPLTEASRQLTRRLEDTVINARSECWWSTTALYTALARIAAGNHEIEVALAPVVAFFAIGKRKKTEPPPPPPTP